jgi:hypothetical protein
METLRTKGMFLVRIRTPFERVVFFTEDGFIR